MLAKTNQIVYTAGFEKFCKLQYGAARFFVVADDAWLLPVFQRTLSGAVYADIPIPILYAEPIALTSQPQPLNMHAVAQTVAREFNTDVAQLNLWAQHNAQILNSTGAKNIFSVHVLEVRDQETADNVLQNRVDKKTRNQITVALKNNFEGKFVTSLAEWYQLYVRHHQTRKYGYKTLIYFECMQEAFGDALHIFGCYSNGTLVGANMFVINKNYLWLVSNISDFSVAALYPNNFLYWLMISRGIAGGIRVFDFGGGTGGDSSIAHFKIGFGARTIPLYAFTYYRSLGSHIRHWLTTKKRHWHLLRS